MTEFSDKGLVDSLGDVSRSDPPRYIEESEAPELGANSKVEQNSLIPQKIFRLQTIFIGSLLLLLLFMVGFLVTVDEDPSTHSDLQVEIPFAGPGDPCVISGVIEISARLPEIDDSKDWLLALEDWSPGAWKSVDDGILDIAAWVNSGALDFLEQYIEANEEIFDQLALVSKREFFGHQDLKNSIAQTPVIGYSELSRLLRLLEDRVLWHRLRNDHDAASRDLELLLLLSERSATESGEVFHRLGIRSLLRVWEQLDSLAVEGNLSPETETRLIERIPLLDRDPSLFSRIARDYYRMVMNTIVDLITFEKEITSFIPDDSAKAVNPHSPWFKKNRTIRRIADMTREVIAYQGVEPHLRSSQVERQSILIERWLDQLNSGEQLIQQTWPPFAWWADWIGQLDRLKTVERGGRLQLLLLRHERLYGHLPADLTEVASQLGDDRGAAIDPFSGQKFCYDQTNRLIWSVGPDLKSGPPLVGNSFGSLRDREELSDWPWSLEVRRRK